MPSRTIIRTQGGVSKNLMVNRDRKAGVKTLLRSGRDALTVNRTAPVIDSDRKGESRPLLSKVVGGAAAAYSLRDLNDKQGNNKVVRVRRESDNHERDFLAKEISNGTLESFVNSQVTAPLDIQALTSTGRNGNFLIPKAAYSLRSLGTRQATVTSSGDTDGDTSGKFVCQVRRNINGDLKSFTADEVTDGTLLSFVNESFTSSLPLDVEDEAVAAYSLRNLSSSYSGNVVEVRRSSDNTTENFTAAEVTNGTLLAFVGTGGLDNGFVETWYDQSGNSRDLHQPIESNQPKIVSAGALLNELVFDGSDDFLQTTDNFDEFGAASLTLFTVINPSDVSGNPRFLNTRSSTAGIELISNSQMKLYYKDSSNNGTTGNNQGASLSAGTEVLYTCIVDRDTDQTVEPFKNGSSLSLSSPPDFTGVGSVDSAELTIGANNSGTQVYNGKTKEIIIYASNLEANRRVIEEGIATNYGITLSSFNRDGFVKTWYDQSVTNQAGDTATGNHATQATASKQPKIVDAGSFVTDGGLLFGFGSNQKLDFAGFTIQEEVSIFSVVKFNDLDSGSDIIGGDGGDASFGIVDDTNYSFKNNATDEEGDLGTTLDTSSYNLMTMLFGQSASDADVVTFTNGIEGELIETSSGDFEANTIGDNGSFGALRGNIKEVIIYDFKLQNDRAAIEANMGEHYSISGIPAFDNSVNGFVETWYDQSGNNNHAVQATASLQPKIVNAGSLLTAGVTFDGGDSLSVSGDPVITASSSGTFSAFSVQTVATSEAGYLYGNASTSNGSSLYAAVNTFALSDKTHINHDTISRIVAPSGGQNLLSAVYNDGDAGLLVNGAGTMTDAGTYDFSAGTGDFVIGNRNGGTVHATFLTGSINEIIIYVSNQEANRPAIEANLANQYDITLS